MYYLLKNPLAAFQIVSKVCVISVAVKYMPGENDFLFYCTFKFQKLSGIYPFLSCILLMLWFHTKSVWFGLV